MWLFTTEGFFSIVQKPGDTELTIRARSRADLERLAKHTELGPIIEGGGTDYPYRVRASREVVALMVLDQVRALDYSNFKSAVGKRMGGKRAHTYSDIWGTLLNISKEPDARGTGGKRSPNASDDDPPRGLKRAYGGVILRGGAVLLRRPTNDFDDYVWTFAKGKPDGDESPEETALQEVQDETGIVGRIVGELPGWFSSSSSATKFFVMEVAEDTGSWDPKETQTVEWVPLSDAADWVGQTRNPRGRARDLKVLEAIAAFLDRETKQ
jgi:8-oxo-dGTP pyrophosphatase MutT (NUDIX family)